MVVMRSCLEDETEDYQNCSVLCCVRRLYTVIHTREQFLQMSVGLGLAFVHLFSFSIFCFFWLRLDYFVLVLLHFA